MSAAIATPIRLAAGQITSLLISRIPYEIQGAKVWPSKTPWAANLTGIAPDGRRIEILAKYGLEKLAQQQRTFLAMVNAHGGIGIVARDVDAAIAELRERCTFSKTISNEKCL